jgi:SHS2 domain-containing protein
LLEHTADMGLAATGETLGDLFQAAARGLRAILTADRPRTSDRWESVTVTGEDAEELLVNWLNEILYRIEVKGFFPEGFAVDDISGTRLVGRIGGATLDRRRHRFDREIKAVTWHRLLVVHEDGRWRARVYVDL